MLFETILLPGVIVPMVAAAALFGLVHVLVRRRERDGRGAGLAVATAFFSAHVAISGWPRWPPVEASQRLLFVVAVVAAAAWLFALWRGRALPAVVRGIVLAGLLGLLLQSQVEHRWSGVEAAAWLLGLLLAALAFDWALGRNLDSAVQGSAGVVAASVRLAVVGGSALALGLGESARLAQLAGALAGAMLAVEIVARLLGRRAWHGSDGLVLTSAGFGLLAIGYFYAQLGALPAILLLAAFLLLGLPPSSIWARLAPLVPLAIALGILIAAALAEEDDPYADYGALGPAPSVAYDRA